MTVARIAFRNVFRHRRRSLLTGLMMGGGCFLFAVFIGIADGSYALLIDNFTRGRTGHIQVHAGDYLEKPSLYKTITEPEKVGSVIGGLRRVESWSPRVLSPALAFAGSKTAGAGIVGMEPGREARTTRIGRNVKQGRFLREGAGSEVVIGEGLAKILRVEVGGEVALIAQGFDGSVANGLFTVAGITGTEAGSAGYSCYMDIDRAREFLVLGGRAHEIAVVLTDYRLTSSATRSLRDALRGRGLEVSPWQEVERQFYRAMRADIRGNWLSIMVLAVIVSVGVLNTVLMVILERTSEFGVLKALGTRPRQVFAMIVLETLYLALGAAAAGTAAGAFANWLLSVHGIALSTPVEYGGMMFEKILGANTVRSVLLPPVIILGAALLVSVPPGVRAARISPARAMRWT